VLRKRIPAINVSVIEVPEDQLDRVQDLLIKSGQFRYVEKDYYAYPADFTPNDPLLLDQWALNKIQAPQAWGSTLGSQNVIIGIIDSGVDPTHEDLASKLVPGMDFLSTSSTDTSDDNGHGTAVAGAAAAATNNGKGIAGVCPFCQLMPLRVAGSNGEAASSNIDAALTYAADHGVRIANISFAGPASSCSAFYQDAINYAWNKGTIVFAAMGNDGASVLNYPAGCNNVIAVGATNPDDSLASFSDFGSWITIVAPGSDILTTLNGGGYEYGIGTSIATPIAAAAAGLALSVNPNLTNAELLALLETNSDSLGPPGFNDQFGWGRVNASRLVKAAIAATGKAPLSISPSPATVNQSQSQQFQITGGTASNAAVSWSVSPAVGTISQNGVYTAPASVTAPVAVNVFANLNPGPALVAAMNVLPPPPVVTAQDILNAASFQSGSIAAGEFISVFGANLSAQVFATTGISFPNSLGGVSVMLKDSSGTELAAPLQVVAPTQINCLVPQNLLPGPVTISVTVPDGQAATANLALSSVAPGVFTANANGKGAPAANAILVGADGTQMPEAVFECGNTGCTPTPINMGESSDQTYLTLYGTGIRNRNSLSDVTVLIGGVPAQVLYAGAQGTYAGLDQINLIIPPVLRGAGVVDVVLTVGSGVGNAVSIAIQ
jgi:uncharacterized protein (TIGR03437 family)